MITDNNSNTDTGDEGNSPEKTGNAPPVRRMARQASRRTSLGAGQQQAVAEKRGSVNLNSSSNDESKQSAGGSTSAAVPPPPPSSAAVNPEYEKYIKMKSMLPEGAVRQKMNVDGFSEDEINAFFRSSGNNSNGDTMSSTPATSLSSPVKTTTSPPPPAAVTKSSPKPSSTSSSAGPPPPAATKLPPKRNALLDSINKLRKE
jgi:hypothetical protein